MTWAYPVVEAVVTTRRGIANGFVATAMGLLAGTLLELGALRIAADEHISPFAFGAVVVLALVVAAARWGQKWLPWPALLAVVLVLGAGAGWLLASSLPSTVSGFPLITASVAVTLAASIVEPRFAATGALLGYIACLIGIHLAADVPLDVAALIAALVIAAFSALLQFVRSRSRAISSRLDSESVSDLAAAERQSLELRSRALMHDTVLNELVSLGMARPGPLSQATATSIRRSLDAALRSTSEPTVAPPSSLALEGILARLGTAGLTVSVSGDPAAVDELAPAPRAALLLALEQCLTNVLRHAGVDRADLTVGIDDDRLIATVADEGVGFDEQAVPQDRFGFRESVRGRITQWGGTVRVLSNPGLGTAIILTLPLTGADQ